MGSQIKLLFATFLILASVIHETHGDTTVTGTVFCDQCKDGQISLFDYPLTGMKVRVTCADGNGKITMAREETTNFLGSYGIKFDGTPDLSDCYAQVMSTGLGSSGCGAVVGPTQQLRLIFQMFDMQMYSVNSLLAQPAQPMSFCPKSSNPVPAPVTPANPSPVPVPVIPSNPPPVPVVPSNPPPVSVPVIPSNPPPATVPVSPLNPPPVNAPVTRHPPPPSFRVPPLPPMPPMPFLEATACSHKYWTMPQYKCYWRGVNPDTKVSVIFGLMASRKYGNDITLWQGLQGRGDPYRTLLREATTAFLNSYNSLQFPYNTIDVVQHMNLALMGSQRRALVTALRFLRANSGYGTKATCKFTPCK